MWVSQQECEMKDVGTRPHQADRLSAWDRGTNMPCMLVSVCGMKPGGRGPSWKVGVPLLVSYCKAHPVSRSQTNKIPSLFFIFSWRLCRDWWCCCYWWWCCGRCARGRGLNFVQEVKFFIRPIEWPSTHTCNSILLRLRIIERRTHYPQRNWPHWPFFYPTTKKTHNVLAYHTEVAIHVSLSNVATAYSVPSSTPGTRCVSC